MTMPIAEKVVVACSGAADVGAIADLAARRLNGEGTAKMACLAGIGARHGGNMKTLTEAKTVLAMDGCTHACASKILHDAGFENFSRLCLTELGLNKGQACANQDNIARATTKAAEMLAK